MSSSKNLAPIADLPASLFNFELPEHRIAQKPVEPRDHAKLLVCQSEGRLGAFVGSVSLTDRRFYEIEDLLNSNDLLIRNDAKVLPLRLLGHRELADGKRGGGVEALLLRPVIGVDPSGEAPDHSNGAKDAAPVWTAILHMSARAKPGLKFIFTPGLVAECLSTHEERLAGEGEVRLRFSGFALERMSLEHWLLTHGQIPLPPYIERPANQSDHSSYQTVYASKIGSAAAPTAGFHFTPMLLQKLERKGVRFANLTLHIGIGTFRPMKGETLADHTIHHETFEVSAALAHEISLTRQRGGRVVAVGTTAVRALESWALLTKGAFEPGMYSTNLFITPGFQFQVVDDLITNFHLPKSTLLTLVATACQTIGSPLPSGVRVLKMVYEHALQGDYRFFSYGDAMFLRGR